MARDRSGIDFHPDDSGFDDDDLEVDFDLASAAQSTPRRDVRHDRAPAPDPDAMRPRVSWDDTAAPKPNAAIGPAFALLLILIVAAMVGAAWWWVTPSERQVEVQKHIKSQTF